MSCQDLCDKEATLRSQIAQEKNKWREEKTSLVYAVSASEKEFGKQKRDMAAVFPAVATASLPVLDDTTRHLEEMRVSPS